MPCIGFTISALPPSAAIVKAARQIDRAPSGKVSNSFSAARIQETGRVFLGHRAVRYLMLLDVVIFDNVCPRKASLIQGDQHDVYSAFFFGDTEKSRVDQFGYHWQNSPDLFHILLLQRSRSLGSYLAADDSAAKFYGPLGMAPGRFGRIFERGTETRRKRNGGR
jgi:hypothetical protein